MKFNLLLPTSLLLLLFGANNMALAQGQPAKTSAKDVEAAKQRLGSIMASENVHLSMQAPSNFPAPIYKSNVTLTTFMNSTKGPPVANLSIITRDAPDVVFQWYQQSLKASGWSLRIASPKLMAKLGTQGQMYMLDAAKDQQGVKLMCMLDKATNGTTVTVGWVKNR